MARDTMSKTSKVARQTTPPGVPHGKPGRLPVARKNASAPPAKLAGRGEKNAVAVVADFGDELEELPGLAAELIRINKEKAALDEEAAIYRSAVKDLMGTINDKESWSVRSENTDWIATYIKPKPGKKLMPELLIKAGVSTQQLKKGYKETPAKDPYVQVRTKGEKVWEEHE